MPIESNQKPPRVSLSLSLARSSGQLPPRLLLLMMTLAAVASLDRLFSGSLLLRLLLLLFALASEAGGSLSLLPADERDGQVTLPKVALCAWASEIFPSPFNSNQ